MRLSERRLNQIGAALVYSATVLVLGAALGGLAAGIVWLL